jgi:hypothetical protein
MTKIRGCEGPIGFFAEKIHQISHVSRQKPVNLPYLDIAF